MSIIVDATLWQTYTGGVITSASGCGTSLDHAVQVVILGGATRSGLPHQAATHCMQSR
jgi:hypothetical protein